MSLVRRKIRGLVAVLVGTAALTMVGTGMAQSRPERRAAPARSAESADPGAKALKTSANEAKALTAKIDQLVDNMEKAVSEAESETDKIKDKTDRAAIANADKKVETVKMLSTKLGEEAGSLKQLASKMDREISKLKK